MNALLGGQGVIHDTSLTPAFFSIPESRPILLLLMLQLTIIALPPLSPVILAVAVSLPGGAPPSLLRDLTPSSSRAAAYHPNISPVPPSWSSPQPPSPPATSPSPLPSAARHTLILRALPRARDASEKKLLVCS